MKNYHNKYLKYKFKYLNLLDQSGGEFHLNNYDIQNKLVLQIEETDIIEKIDGVSNIRLISVDKDNNYIYEISYVSDTVYSQLEKLRNKYEYNIINLSKVGSKIKLTCKNVGIFKNISDVETGFTKSGDKIANISFNKELDEFDIYDNINQIDIVNGKSYYWQLDRKRNEDFSESDYEGAYEKFFNIIIEHQKRRFNLLHTLLNLYRTYIVIIPGKYIDGKLVQDLIKIPDLYKDSPYFIKLYTSLLTNITQLINELIEAHPWNVQYGIVGHKIKYHYNEAVDENNTQFDELQKSFLSHDSKYKYMQPGKNKFDTYIHLIGTSSPFCNLDINNNKQEFKDGMPYKTSIFNYLNDDIQSRHLLDFTVVGNMISILMNANHDTDIYLFPICTILTSIDGFNKYDKQLLNRPNYLDYYFP